MSKIHACPALNEMVAEKVYGECAHLWEYKPWKSDPCPTCGDERNPDPGPDSDYPTKRCKKCGKEVAGLAYPVNGIPQAKPRSSDPGEALRLLAEENRRRVGNLQRPLSLFTQGWYPAGRIEWHCGLDRLAHPSGAGWMDTPELAIVVGVLLQYVTLADIERACEEEAYHEVS